jgi:hypothetical protein
VKCCTMELRGVSSLLAHDDGALPHSRGCLQLHAGQVGRTGSAPDGRSSRTSTPSPARRASTRNHRGRDRGTHRSHGAWAAARPRSRSSG